MGRSRCIRREVEVFCRVGLARDGELQHGQMPVCAVGGGKYADGSDDEFSRIGAGRMVEGYGAGAEVLL